MPTPKRVSRAAAEPTARDHLLERAQHLVAIDRALDAAKGGAGRAVLIEGAAGLGKSQLLAEAARRAEERAMQVVAARAGELESGLAHGLVLQLFEPAVTAADEAEREAALAGAAGLARPLFALDRGVRVERHATLHGLLWLVSNLSERRPLLIAVDDLHWADVPSLDWLLYLCHRIGDLPVALVMATRRGEPGAPEDLLSRIAAEPHVEPLAVAPLSEHAVNELVTDRLPAAESAFVTACLAVTGGNPFLLSELIDEAERRGVAPTAAGAADLELLASEDVLRAAVARLARLPPACAALARAVAVLGSARISVAAALAGLDPEPARAAVRALAGVQLVHGRQRLEFVHPLLRAAVYSDIEPVERAQAHARAARLVDVEDGAVGRVAAHLELAPPQADPWAAEQLSTAALQDEREGAPAVAARLLRRALDEPPPEARRGALLLQLARAEAAAGEPTAVDRLRAAIDVASGRERAEMQLELGRLLYAAGRPREAAEAFEAGARDVAGPDDPLALELEAAWVTVARIEVSLRPRAVKRLQAIIEREPGSSASYEERSLLAQVANELVFEGRAREQAVTLARRALADGTLLEREGASGMGWVVGVAALGWSDEIDEYHAHSRAALGDAERRGSVLAFATASYALSFSSFAKGRLADAVADCEQALAAEPHGWSQFVPAARAQLAWAQIERDDLGASAATLGAGELDRAWAGSSMLGLVLDARARLALARGDGEDALAAALEAGGVMEAALIHNPACLQWRSNAALAAASLGDHERARELAADELARAREFGAARAVGVALRAAGVAERGAGGIDLLEQSVRVLDSSAAVIERVSSLVALGSAQRRSGRRAAARETLRAGASAARRLGATRLERVAGEELSAAGARPRSRPLTGLDSLTPGERRVAELAAGGMTNPQIAQALFVTVKAVKWHLRHVFQKLEISSRTELAPIFRRADD